MGNVKALEEGICSAQEGTLTKEIVVERKGMGIVAKEVPEQSIAFVLVSGVGRSEALYHTPWLKQGGTPPP